MLPRTHASYILFFLSFVILVTEIPAALAAAPAKLQQVEEQLNANQQKKDVLDESARTAAKNLEDLREKLIASTQSLQDKQGEAEALEDRLDALAEEITEKSKKAVEERSELSEIISALVQIASRPPETLFLQDGLTSDHIHRSLLLRAILPRIKEQAESTARDLSTLYDLQTQMAEQKRLVAAAQANLEKQQHDLDQLIAARQGFLKRTVAQKAAINRHLAALTSEAKDLRQLMQRVAPSAPHTAKPTPHSDMALKWPVSGSVKRPFGDKDSDGVVSQGLVIAAPSGAPIVAPFSGKVAFAGPFRGYGDIVILQHANGYHSFLSGFGRIDAEMGQDVAAGEPLGVLPVKTGTKPELYFEWRHGDAPIDPAGGLPAHASGP